MVTGTRARSYEEMVDALAEGLPMLQDTLSGLTPEDWQRPTLLRPPEPGKPPWTVLQLAAHFDVFMGLTMPLVAEPMSAQPVVDRASFYISVSDRSKVSPVIYQYIVDHAEGHTPATIRDQVGKIPASRSWGSTTGSAGAWEPEPSSGPLWGREPAGPHGHQRAPAESRKLQLNGCISRDGPLVRLWHARGQASASPWWVTVHGRRRAGSVSARWRATASGPGRA
jgi:hypothetical protein